MDDLVPGESGGSGPRELHVDDGAFDQALDLLIDDVVLATLFWDPKPECAFAELEVEDENGGTKIAGAEAGLDEDPVGWCLLFTDAPLVVFQIGRDPGPESTEQALRAAWMQLASRLSRVGVWRPAERFRLWSVGNPDSPSDPA